MPTAKKSSDEPKLSRSEQFSVFLYNKENNTYCGGRSGDSWRKILAFYFVFYVVLALFWAMCFGVFLESLPDRNGDTSKSWYDWSGPRVGNILKFGVNDASFRAVTPYSISATPATGMFDRLLGNDNATYQTAEYCGPDYGLGTNQPCVLWTTNRKWDYPKLGADLSVTCTQRISSNSDPAVDIPASQISCLDQTTGARLESQLFLNNFKNQKDYVVPFLAVKLNAVEASRRYTIECQFTDCNSAIEEDGGCFSTRTIDVNA